MPAVRGSTFGYETSTGDAGVVIPVCPNVSGDFLLAIVMADTGALTTFTATPPSGWAIMQEWFNTTPMIAYGKIAGGSETDLTIAATTHAVTAETYNGSMTAFRDIDSATPLGVSALSSYASSNQDFDQVVGNGAINGVSQSFTTPAATANTNNRGCLATAKFWLKKVGSPTGNAVAKLYAHSGTLGTSSVPTGAALATSNNFNVATLTTSYAMIELQFATWFQFAANTNYVIAIEYSGGDGTNHVLVGVDAGTPSHVGNAAVFSVSWTALSGFDCIFSANRFTLNFANSAASARQTLPVITTEKNNAMVLFIGGGSGSAGTPSIVEGPVTQIHGSDGIAESHALGYTVQATSGSTPSTARASMTATGASVMGTAEIRPPVSGAVVVPPYCAADLAALVDFIAGTTGFNGNTGLAATAGTNFGTNIGGYTANGAAVAIVTDAGINSFHSMAGMTNAAIAGQVSGAELIIAAANRFNFSSKNLLGHVKAAGPAHLQRFPAAASGRGFWMGVRSNTGSGGATTGWKVWRAHGVEAPWGSGAYIPIIINTGAGNTVGTSGTLDAAVVTSIGFWTSGIAALTAQMLVGPCWLMDTTTVCGGSSAEPLDAGGIAKVCGIGKERYSALQQGAKQALVLQLVQVGDGGANPVYLDLDGCAFEFPRQYNLSKGEVNYNSINDKCGFTIYAGAADTIKCRNAIFSSPSRYLWGLHASSSTAATYDFSGTSVIGAGAITLNRAIVINGLTLNSYVTLNLSGATFQNGTIKGAPAANDSLTTSGATSIDNCAIDCSGVTSGNRLCSVADPSIFENNNFTGGGGHAIRITTTGTYTFTGNTFTSFGADGSNGAAIFNDSGGAVTINIVGGGGTPTVRNGAGASTTVNNAVTLELTGLIAGSRIYVRNMTDSVDLYNEIEATTTFTKSINFTANKSLLIRVRNASGTPKYKPFETTGTLTSAGFALVVNQVFDQ